MAPLPPVAAGIWNGAMAAPCAKYWSGTVADPNDGAVSVSSTSICPVVMSASPAWAAASTFTASFASAPSVPVWDSVSVALVPPAVAVAEAMETPLAPVTSSKLDAPTPLANVVSDSDTVTVAPFSVAAVRIAGDAMAALSVSSSFTATCTAGRLGRPKKSPPPQMPLTRLWLMVAASSQPSASLAAVTVKVCGVFQSLWSNASRVVRGVPSVSSVTSALLLAASTITEQLVPLVVLGLAVSATV